EWACRKGGPNRAVQDPRSSVALGEAVVGMQDSPFSGVAHGSRELRVDAENLPLLEYSSEERFDSIKAEWLLQEPHRRIRMILAIRLRGSERNTPHGPQRAPPDTITVLDRANA